MIQSNVMQRKQKKKAQINKALKKEKNKEKKNAINKSMNSEL